MLAATQLSDQIKGFLGSLLAPVQPINKTLDANARTQLLVSELESEVQFDQLRSNSGRRVFQFHADWCEPCDQQLSTLKRLAIDSDLEVVRIDVEIFAELAEALDVELIPTLIVVDDGVPTFRTSGLRTEQELRDALK